MISIVACCYCHSVKLCALASRAFRSQQYFSVTTEWQHWLSSALLHVSVKQRWHRIQSAGVDSGRMLRFSFGPRVKNV